MRAILETRILGVASVVRHAKPRMLRGSIVLMSGLYASHPRQRSAMAAAAVAGIEGLVRALALDLAPLRVNAVSPGTVDTPLWDSFGSQRTAVMEHGAGLPVGRVGRPEEIAEAVLFLMSNEFITGIVLPIDGGGSLI
jgi:NAD(P)-dependent dehydrogenase (short-subunit alcohol dehydrogenase family)